MKDLSKVKNKLVQSISQFNWSNFIKTHWLIIALTIVAAFLRLYNFRSTLIFLGDQARDALIVRDLLTKFDPILVGPTTSVGKIQLGPFYYYFMAPFLLLSNFNPVGPALAVAFLGIITIPILYFVCLKMFDKTIAIIASILFTFSNVLIANTRFSWNPNPMPFFIIILIYSLYQVYHHKKYPYLVGLFLSLGIALQLHYMAIILIPGLTIISALLIFNTKANPKDFAKFKKYLIKGLLLFFILAIPLIIFDLTKDYLNLKGFLEFFQKGNHTTLATINIFPRITQRLTQTTSMIVGIPNFHGLYSMFSQLIIFFSVILFFLKRKNQAIQIILILFITSYLGLIIYSGDIYEHYLGFIYPITIILISLIFSHIFTINKISKFLVAISLIYLVYLNLSTYRFYSSLGWTIDDTKNLSKVIAKDIGDQPFNIILLDDTKDYRAMQYRYFLYDTQIYNYDNYSPTTLYLISQRDQYNLETLEIGELRMYFSDSNFDINSPQMTPDQNAQYLDQFITQDWHFTNGPYVYKLMRN